MLTDIRCRTAKPGDKPFKLYDEGGLYLLIKPNGGRFWHMKFTVGGREKKLSFGPYGVGGLSLVKARDKRDDARAKLRNGDDPAAEKQLKKRALVATKPFRDWADEWLGKEGADLGTKTMAGKTRCVEYLKGRFGKRQMIDIKRTDVLLFLREFEREDKLETRDRIRAAGEAIFRYADIEGDTPNPFRKFEKQLVKNVSEPRPAYVQAGDVAELMRKLAAPFPGARYDDLVGLALRFISLTAVRPGELAKAEWSEFDLDGARWTIPGERMKMRKAHIVPLSRQAVEILRQVDVMTGERNYVFSCNTDAPISDNTLNKRLRDLDIDTGKQHCAHGFRSTFSTTLNAETDSNHDKVWDRDLIELQLAHLDTTSVRAVYDRNGPMALYAARAKMMQAWADKVDAFREGGKTLDFRKREEVA
jgi:integrase